jgi:serpin B
MAGGNELLTANSLWVQEGFRIQSPFQRTLETLYGAAPRPLRANPDAARAEINSWTAQRTKGRIRELFGPGSLGAGTRLALVSATYYYGKWQARFRAENTRPEPFHLNGGRTVEAQFMNQTGRFDYGETEAAQILEMKYAGTGLALDVLMPKPVTGLSALEKSIDAEILKTWLGRLESRSVEVATRKMRKDWSVNGPPNNTS